MKLWETTGARPPARFRSVTSRGRSAIPASVWTEPGTGEGESVRSLVGRIMSGFPDRAPNAIVLTAAVRANLVERLEP